MSDIVVFQGIAREALGVMWAMAPLIVMLIVFRLMIKPPPDFMKTTLKGLAIAFFGLTLFLHGVHIAFLPVGQAMGEVIGNMEALWLAVPIGMALGFVATMAEPAVRVLCAQVSQASSGSINEKLMLYTLAGGVSAFWHSSNLLRSARLCSVASSSEVLGC